MGHKDKLVPYGILNMMTGLLTIIFGTSFETSDFIADCLEQWWNDNKASLAHITQLVINLDNGPQNSSYRTQFMKRMVEFADKYNIEIVLAYYPPYHSKYNPVERAWGILENHWGATLLNTVESTLEWAKTMTWKGKKPVVKLQETVYQKGIRLSKKEFKTFSDRIARDVSLPKYHMTICPST